MVYRDSSKINAGFMAVALALGLSSSVTSASTGKLNSSSPAPVKVSSSPKYEACFDVYHNGVWYVVTEDMDQQSGIITSDAMTRLRYNRRSSMPKVCAPGDGFHSRFVSLFYKGRQYP